MEAGRAPHRNASSTPAPVRGGGFSPPAVGPVREAPTGDGPWTLRGLIATHRVIALVVAALCVFAVGVFVMTALGAGAGPVSDATTCQGWSSANVDQQEAYARRYVAEHGPVNRRWGPAPVGVINAINAGCYQAFGEDVSDTTTVVQAINRTF